MRNSQFWILMLASCAIFALYLKQIQLSHAVFVQERNLTDSRETADSAPTYENGWKQLAIRLYQTSKQDPALLDILKASKIGIHTAPPAPTVAPATNNASTKAPGPSPTATHAPTP